MTTNTHNYIIEKMLRIIFPKTIKRIEFRAKQQGKDEGRTKTVVRYERLSLPRFE